MRPLLTAAPLGLGLTLALACASPSSPSSSPSSSSPTSSSSNRSSSTAPARTSKDPAKPSKPSPSADPFATAFVDAHNRVRASVSPRADPALPPVRWSDELAATARAWARRCKFEHSNSDHGENLAARTNRADPAAVVASWADEAQHFDLRRNRCASGEVCGHYTQVVWRGSVTIGCAVERCSGGGPFGGGEWFMYVCNYSPPGNWVGERPY